MADTPKVVSTAAPRYIHGIQSNVNASDAWLTPRIQENEQATLMDSYTDYGTTTVEGDLYVMSSSDGPTHHNSLHGRTDPDSHPATAIQNTPSGNIAATTVQAAINELDLEKEGALGNPSVDGYVLSSTTAGARSWVANGAPTYAQIIAILGFEPLSSCGFGLCYGLKYGGRS